MLKRVSPDDTDFALHGVRVEGWNRAAADNAALAEAHGGWKPGNASRYSRFQLADARAGVAALPLLGQPVVAPVESEADG